MDHKEIKANLVILRPIIQCHVNDVKNSATLCFATETSPSEIGFLMSHIICQIQEWNDTFEILSVVNRTKGKITILHESCGAWWGRLSRTRELHGTVAKQRFNIGRHNLSVIIFICFDLHKHIYVGEF